jgi:hypothetical protein
VSVENLDKNLTAIHLALYHVVVSFCCRTPAPCLTSPSGSDKRDFLRMLQGTSTEVGDHLG